jgi:hypothetical protein
MESSIVQVPLPHRPSVLLLRFASVLEADCVVSPVLYLKTTELLGRLQVARAEGDNLFVFQIGPIDRDKVGGDCRSFVEGVGRGKN